jgi:DNA-binding transcriptional MerR regulator
MTVGQVANAAGVTADAIRYYERLGLLPRAARAENGYRMYGPGVVHRLKVVRSAQRFGFSLRQIAAFLGVRDRGGVPCRDVRIAAQQILEAIDRQIAELKTTRGEMRQTLRAWDRLLDNTPPGRQARPLEALPLQSSRSSR